MQDNSSRHESSPEAGPAPDIKRERRVPRPADSATGQMAVDLVAAVVAMLDEQPILLLGAAHPTRDATGQRLPSCQFDPARHETLDEAVQEGVLETYCPGARQLEQLVSRCSETGSNRGGPGVLTVGYMALIRAEHLSHVPRASCLKIYDVLPWEDWRRGRPMCLADAIVPGLMRWLETSNAAGENDGNLERVRIAFGLDDSSWDDERVVERLEILDEAGLLERVSPVAVEPVHRHIVAAALGRLRGRIRHRPVVFDMLPQQFTLFELQRAVEAILGPHLHKQNFRRLVEGMGLVEPTGDVRSHTGGRPARLFRFRPAVMLERAAPGVRIRPGKAA